LNTGRTSKSAQFVETTLCRQPRETRVQIRTLCSASVRPDAEVWGALMQQCVI
jgi:hypothetical protein